MTRVATILTLAGIIALSASMGCSTWEPNVNLQRSPTQVNDPALGERIAVLWGYCDESDAISLMSKGTTDPSAALKAAVCMATLVNTSKDEEQALERTLTGHLLASSVENRAPDSALAFFLDAYFLGRQAEMEPMKGLALVPMIEEKALKAAELNPNLDSAGPHRMLGDLYFQAPGFPVSVGDIDLAMEHYRKASEMAPNFADNRLGVVDVLFEDGEDDEACRELESFASDLPDMQGSESTFEHAEDLLDRCGLD